MHQPIVLPSQSDIAIQQRVFGHGLGLLSSFTNDASDAIARQVFSPKWSWIDSAYDSAITIRVYGKIRLLPGQAAGRTYDFYPDDASGRFYFIRSDASSAGMYIQPDSTLTTFGSINSSLPINLRSDANIIITPANAGGAGLIQLGRRFSDSNVACGASVECWPTSTQTTPALVIMAPGGASYRTKLMPDGSLIFGVTGIGLNIKEGSTNAVMGIATLVAGTVTVSTTKITATSRVQLTVQAPSGAQGFLSLGAVVAGTSFVINSTSGTETSVVHWMIVEPA